MELVQAEVEGHYRSQVVERIRSAGGKIRIRDVEIHLAKEFGFCYGVERALDLAYAAKKVFPGSQLWIFGEIIHNPDVNAQIRALGIRDLSGSDPDRRIGDLGPEDVVIIPAFGAEQSLMDRIRQQGCRIVDTTCGDVMNVWKRVRQNAREGVTSIIHGKVVHEETRATASRARTPEGTGHYLIVRDLREAEIVCSWIRSGGDRGEFLRRFAGATSEGFDPERDLSVVGVANQTTMMRGETEEIQRRVRSAIADRWGEGEVESHFRFFDTICGATQARQDALATMLGERLDLLLVIGGYNSSNTTHLAEIGEAKLPTFFVKNAEKIISRERIHHFDIRARSERESTGWLPEGPVVLGITAGASCPNNLIEDVVLRVFALRGIDREAVLAASGLPRG
jgi:4-hydroxy-3-methylbut-2-enyl diphosphate reductase